MSKASRSKVAFGAPPKGAVPRPSSIKASASGAKSSCGASATSRSCLRPPEASKKSKFNLPALSIPPKNPPVDPVLEKLRRRTMRRNAPEGEDLKKIKEIVKSLRSEVITVQEFVGLVSPYTGDNGNVVRTVMGDDLSTFRKMAKRVYDTMTQDVSDVLANEHINVNDFYNERYTLTTDKMMRTIDEIYRYAPDFDFELYYQDPEEYLKKLFPVSPDLVMDPEEEDMQRRQEAYHRLQWLRSEGTRLSAENNQLQSRLKQLKRQQQEELNSAKQQEEVAAARKTHLEATQADLENQIDELNESVEKSIIITEEDLRLEQDSNAKRNASRKHTAQLKKSKMQQQRDQQQVQEPWNVKAAKQIEEESFVKTAQSTMSNISMASTASRTRKKKVVKSKIKFKKPPPQETSPFHFSPIKTPPQAEARPTSPFHYSPPKSPPRTERPPARRGPQAPVTVRTETSTTVIEEASQSRQLPAARRNLAPRDSWGGYY